MLKNNPLITVVIPVYNRQELVLETLESLNLQSFQNWECIIVDDYSTDNSAKVISNFIKKDNRFKLITKSNEKKGAPVSRNIGWRAAKADYILFLDSDDLLAPWALENRLNLITKNKELDFGLFSNLEFKKNGANYFNTRTNFGTKDALKQFLQFNTTWQTSNPLWDKCFLNKISGWDEEALSWQDGEINVRALNSNPKYLWGAALPDTFIRLDGEEKITNNHSLNKIVNNLFIFNKIVKVLSADDQKLFLKNIQILIYNMIERLDFSSAINYINSKELQEFKFPSSRLKIYTIIYHSTKKIPVLRKAIYLIREKTTLFPKRKKFFIKNQIEDKLIEDLKLKLKGIKLFEKNLKWLS